MKVKRAKQLPKNGKPLIQTTQLVIRPTNREVLDPGKWRRALRDIDHDRYVLFYDLIEDIMLDSVLSDAIDKRIRAVTNAGIVFAVDGKPVEEMDDLIDSIQFEDMLREVMLSQFLRISVLEFDFTDGFNFNSFPRKHIRPKSHEITISQSDPTGWDYLNDPFILQAGSPKEGEYGPVFKAALYAIFKRGGFGDWAQFVEIFGMPFRSAKYNPYDEDTRKLLTEAMEKMGSSPWIVVPNDTEIDVQQNASTANGDLYEKFKKACNEEILISILGQTMTTLDGSSRSQSEVHQDVLDEINQSDRRFVQRWLNSQLLPLLEARGYPVHGGWFSFPEKAEKISLTDRLTKIDLPLNSIVRIDPEYWYDTYGIPKPQDGNMIPEPSPAPAPDPETETTVIASKAKQSTQKEATTKTAKDNKLQNLSLRERWMLKLSDFFGRAHED